jgi:hypothetical protein
MNISVDNVISAKLLKIYIGSLKCIHNMLNINVLLLAGIGNMRFSFLIDNLTVDKFKTIVQNVILFTI